MEERNDDIAQTAREAVEARRFSDPTLEALRVQRDAYAAIAIVSTKSAAHFSRSAGGYFAGMVRKDERGELRLERSLWALREAKWGKASRRRVN
jgi:Replication protein C C-terminal region